MPEAVCQLCGSGDREPYTRSEEADWRLHAAQVRCRACGLVASEPLASEARLAAYYRDEYNQKHWSDVDALAAENLDRYRRCEWPLLADLWRGWLAPGGRVLEVGCGVGAMLTLLAEEGFAVEGCEPNTLAVEACRRRGLTVVSGTVPGAAVRGPYDLVLAMHVVEHVTDPRAFVSALTGLARPGGVVALVTEDSWNAAVGLQRLGARLRGRRPPFYTSHEHTFVFAAAHLERLLAEAGCAETRARSFSCRPPGESAHWRLYLDLLGMANRIAGRGDFLAAVGRVGAR